MAAFKTELSRFRVQLGMSAMVDEWMAMLNARMNEALATFPRERMYVEAIVRERVGDEEYLYWFPIQGEGGESVHTSDHDLDKEHLRYWDLCIDRSSPRANPDHQVEMIPPCLIAAMVHEEGTSQTRPVNRSASTGFSSASSCIL